MNRYPLWLYVTVAGTVFDNTPHENTGNYSPVQAGGGERPLRFGAGHLQPGDPEKFFAGRIDEVAFYQLVLPEVTVEEHFNLLAPADITCDAAETISQRGLVHVHHQLDATNRSVR